MECVCQFTMDASFFLSIPISHGLKFQRKLVQLLVLQLLLLIPPFLSKYIFFFQWPYHCNIIHNFPNFCQIFVVYR